MKTKEEVIKEIKDFHPHYGVERELSWYKGGMYDTGGWYEDKLCAMDYDDLVKFLDEITGGKTNNEGVGEKLDRLEAELKVFLKSIDELLFNAKNK